MKKNRLTLEDLQADDLISLMEIYLSEWCHRDQMLWSQVFRFFYVTVLVTFLPNLVDFLGVRLPSNLPNIIFPIAGMCLSLVFLYVSLGYTKRLEAASEVYKRLISFLPPHLQRHSLSDKEIRYGKFFSQPMSIVLCLLMFTGCLFLSVFMLIYYLQF